MAASLRSVASLYAVKRTSRVGQLRSLAILCRLPKRVSSEFQPGPFPRSGELPTHFSAKAADECKDRLPSKHSARWPALSSRAITDCVGTDCVRWERRRFHANATLDEDADLISFEFVEPDGTSKKVSVPSGTTILEAAHSNGVHLEGSCEGQCSCSTCHVILEEHVYRQLPEPSCEEDDMLDLAACLTDTSRLGCQVRVTEAMKNTQVKLPAITRNFYVDGHKPQPH